MKIDHVAIYVQDLEGMKAFYETYFNVTIFSSFKTRIAKRKVEENPYSKTTKKQPLATSHSTNPSNQQNPYHPKPSHDNTN